VTLHSLTTGETSRFNVRTRVKRGDPPWSNYVRGVVAGFQKRRTIIPGFDAVIASSVPFGGGLSSSAALEVSTATLMECISRRKLDPVAKALLCQKAEHDYPGVPCGIMDQFTSVLAKKDHALLLDCRSQVAKPVAMKDPSITVVIINTNVRHKLADGEYARRRAQCEKAARAMDLVSLRDATLEGLADSRKKLEPVVFRRARHVLTENARTLEMAKALQASDWENVGRLMYESHESLKTDYEVSCRELDTVVEIARSLGSSAGVIGCRMTGGGFGGCAVSLVKTEALAHLTRQMDAAYANRTGIQATIFSSRPAGGARVLKKG
jgi:galactokinase